MYLYKIIIAFWSKSLIKMNSINTTFEEISFQSHESWFAKQFPDEDKRLLSAIIFKVLPDNETIQKLKNDGYLYYEFPKNPYL